MRRFHLIAIALLFGILACNAPTIAATPTLFAPVTGRTPLGATTPSTPDHPARNPISTPDRVLLLPLYLRLGSR